MFSFLFTTSQRILILPCHQQRRKCVDSLKYVLEKVILEEKKRENRKWKREKERKEKNVEEGELEGVILACLACNNHPHSCNSNLMR
jgi:DNA gyrase/topoisomerase IV subunit B